MLRKIIQIDEDKCDGCGNCVPSCAEGALQIIDGKARLISDLFCDGLGACVGDCPTGAMTVTEREAEPYDEKKVMAYIVKGGNNVIRTHLEHLKEHEEFEYLNTAIDYLNEKGIPNPLTETELAKKEETIEKTQCGCPGSQMMSFDSPVEIEEEDGKRISHLSQWPIQLHLISPLAPYYQNSDLLLAADCCAFAYADFHKDYMNGKSLAIACPKLDTNQHVYLEKLKMMITSANLRSISIAIMQVPCCGGLTQLVQQAVNDTQSNIPVNVVVVGINGEILKEVKVA